MSINRLSGLILALACSSGAALAVDYPTKTFDTVMSLTTPEGTREMRLISDGKGHLRSEFQGPDGGKMINITDFPGNTAYMLMSTNKMAMRIPLDPRQQHMIADETAVQKHNGTPIGTKVIDGHPCHGWKFTAEGSTTETWVGDDIHYPVESITTSTSGITKMRLRSYSSAAPSARLFEIPIDYNTMTVPVGMFKMPTHQ